MKWTIDENDLSLVNGGNGQQNTILRINGWYISDQNSDYYYHCIELGDHRFSFDVYHLMYGGKTCEKAFGEYPIEDAIYYHEIDISDIPEAVRNFS